MGLRNAPCEDCAWYDESKGWNDRCAPCRGTGLNISYKADCGLFVPKGEETDRNQYGLEPCTCGCRDVKVYARWRGVGMDESCDCTITCPKCGRMMAADDLGVRWNATMIKERRMMREARPDCPCCKNPMDVRIAHIDGTNTSKIVVECMGCGIRKPSYVCDDNDLALFISAVMMKNIGDMNPRDDE